MSDWQPIETVPSGYVLLWCVPERFPNNAAAIIGQVTRRKPSEFWTDVPMVLRDLPDDAPVSECSIWDGHQYRPMQATHWMPLPTAPQPTLSSTAPALVGPGDIGKHERTERPAEEAPEAGENPA